MTCMTGKLTNHLERYNSHVTGKLNNLQVQGMHMIEYVQGEEKRVERNVVEVKVFTLFSKKGLLSPLVTRSLLSERGISIFGLFGR